MNFVPLNAANGSWRLSTQTYKKTASVVLTNGNLLASNIGYLIAATSTSTNIIGIGQRTTASTDTDYALNSFHPVLVPRNGLDSLMVGTATATATAAQAGTFVDLTDAGAVNTGASSIKVIWFAKYLSATKGIFAINAGKLA